MAITRAQQYRQMLENGGRGISLQEAKDMAPKGEFLAYINKKEAKMLKDAGGSGIMTNAGIPSFIEYGSDDPDTFSQAASTGSVQGDVDRGGGGGDENNQPPPTKPKPKAPPRKPKKTKDNTLPTLNLREKFRVNRLKKLYENKFLPGQNKFAPIAAQVFQSLTPTQLSVYEESDPMFDAAYYGMTGEDITDTDRLAKAINQAEKTGNISQSEFEDAFFGPGGRPDLSRDDDGPDSILPIIPKMDDTENTTPVRNLAGLTPRIGGSLFNFDEFAADGGRIGAAEGGIMELARQEMFLGGIAKGLKKAVKGVSRAVKKVAKSPIGKAAILGAIGFGIPGTQFGGIFGKGAASSFFGKGSFSPFKAMLDAGTADAGFGPSGLGRLLGKTFVDQSTGSLTGLGKILSFTAPSLIAAATAPKQDDEFDLASYYASQQLTPSQSVRGVGSEMDFYNYNLPVTAADGGRIGYQEGSKEPVAKETMPLLDMDGKEMDLREEGGFVPIGRMEKADDVPARLSKNEFVFTADAVRNAGDGDVDKGAEVMYNMMKNLESGGDVSEESQGLEGAREMFQTSKRLEEVL